MKKYYLLQRAFIILIIVTCCVLTAQPAGAQDTAELSLRLSRVFGYASGRGVIQGTFSMRVTGPENLSRVEYYIDDTKIGEVSQAPFNWRFSTDNFNLGNHRLVAIGFTQDGRELRSNEIQAEFVSASEGMRVAGSIIIPILVLVVVAMLFSAAASLSSSRRLQHLPAGAPRKYGPAGGAICPKCQRPFSRNILSPNMLFGKLERCPFCGKWSIVRARSMDDLRSAELAELQDAQHIIEPVLNEEEKLRQELEESRFQDL